MDENLVTVKINENPIINLEITTYKNEADVNILQSKGDKGDRGEQGFQGPKGNDGITPDTDVFVNKTTTINNKALSSNITLTTADINECTDKRYCTDAQKTIISNTSGTNTGDQDLSSYAKTAEVNSALASKANSSAIPTSLSALSEDSTHRLTTDNEKATWNGKQNALGFTPLSNSDSTVTKQGNTFNGVNQLVQLRSDGKLPAIDGSLLTGISGGGLAYTAENVANKAIDLINLSYGDDTQYPSAKAVRDALDSMGTYMSYFAMDGFVVHTSGVETITGVKTFSSGIILGAGSLSIAPIKMTSGPLLAAATAGASEFLNGVFYQTPIANSRGVVPIRHYICNSTAYTLANSTSAQSVFGKSISLAASTLYRFRGLYNIGTGATTHTTSSGFGVTNSLTSCNYLAKTISAALNTTTTNINTVMVSGTTAKVLNATSTAVTTLIELEGVIRTNLATILTPQITFSAAPGTTCQTYNDSFFEIEPIGSSTDTSCGAWS